MFSSPTAWEGLYGRASEGVDGFPGASMPQPRSAHPAARGQAGEEWLGVQHSRGNEDSTMEASTSFPQSAPPPPHHAAGYRSHAPTPEEHHGICQRSTPKGPFLFSSSADAPYTVVSQPVRIFPAPPPHAPPPPVWASGEPLEPSPSGYFVPATSEREDVPIPYALPAPAMTRVVHEQWSHRTAESGGDGGGGGGRGHDRGEPYPARYFTDGAYFTGCAQVGKHDLAFQNTPYIRGVAREDEWRGGPQPAAYSFPVYSASPIGEPTSLSYCTHGPTAIDKYYESSCRHNTDVFAEKTEDPVNHQWPRQRKVPGDCSLLDAARPPLSYFPSTEHGQLDGAACAAVLTAAHTPSPPEQPAASPCLSISDGARHLNAVRHRNAAAASAVFLSAASLSPISTRGSALDSTPFQRGGHERGPTSPCSSATASASMAAAPAVGAVTPTEPCCVAAVIFNSAKEVGVALCELPSLTISLLQYADTAVFFKTASLLHSRNPVEVLVPATVVDTEFVQTLLQQHGRHMTFTSVQRCFYHTEEGVQRLSQLKSSEEAALCIEDTDRYLCVAAANALVLYMEHVNDMQLLPGSVRVRAEALEHYMEVSRTTARALQIIAYGSGSVGVVSGSGAADRAGNGEENVFHLRSGRGDGACPSSEPTSRRRPRSTRASSTVPSTFSSCGAAEETTVRAEALVDVVPRTCTFMGQRYLRRTLLQPLRDRIAVQGRHDTVEWLLCDPRRLHMLRALLRHTAALDLERLTATLTLQPRRERTDAQKQAYLESLLLLWSALPYLERLHTQLSACLGTGADTTHVSWPGPAPSPPSSSAVHSKKAEAMAHDVAPSASTPAYPSVLHSVATTLRQCRFMELTALMGRYLERSVLPSVVEHHQASPHTVQRGRGDGQCSFANRTNTTTTALFAQDSSGRALTSQGPPRHRKPDQGATATLLRVLRMCFLVQAPRGGELDALRTRLSQRIAGITAYADEVRQGYQLHSLRLEPDPVKLYCFSYLSSEGAKAQAAPFTWRYAGGSHFALYLAALRQQQEQQGEHQERAGHRRARDSSSPTGNSDRVRDSWDDHHNREDALRGFTSYRRRNSSSHDPLLSSAGETSSSASGQGGGFAGRGAAPLSALPTQWGEKRSSTSTGVVGGDGWTTSAQLSKSHDGRRERRRVRCSTEDLEYRCTRTQECVAAILTQQLHAVTPLVQAIRLGFLGALQATVESVALLDTLLSFALYSLSHHCTRPVMVELKTGLTTAPERPTLQMDSTEEAAGDAATPSSISDAPTCRASDSRMTSLLADAAGATVMEAKHRADNADWPGRRFPFFLRGAFHPSVGVASTQLSSTRPLSGAASAAAAPLRTSQFSMRHPAGDGLCLSWGSTGEVCIITGPNACGKTTLLRVVGQHITLAQAGCFVPARQAQLFLSDRVFAHMLCDELPSVLHSSFKRELMELNEVTHAATEESLVLVDELGRSTTTAQGFALAWATALALSDRHVHAVLTSHFAGLPSLARVRPQRVRAYHFRVSLAQLAGVGTPWQRQQGKACDNAEGVGAQLCDDAVTRHEVPASPRVTIVRFGHELFSGPCPQRWYGLAMAERMGFFEPVLALARRTRACQLAGGDEEKEEKDNTA